MGESQNRLTLLRGSSFGWTMWPGYVDAPYYSPIIVQSIDPLGDRTFNLDFINLRYAAGVQQMVYKLQTFKRGRNYLLANVLNSSDDERAVAIEPLTRDWFSNHLRVTETDIDCLFDSEGLCTPDILLKIFAI